MSATIVPTRRELVASIPVAAALSFGGKQANAKKRKKRVKPLIIAAAHAISYTLVPGTNPPRFEFAYRIEGVRMTDPPSAFTANITCAVMPTDFDRVATIVKRRLLILFSMPDEAPNRVMLYLE